MHTEGLPLDTARALLSEAGYTITEIQYEAPHTKGEELRVIRQRLTGKHAELVVSRFKTQVD